MVRSASVGNAGSVSGGITVTIVQDRDTCGQQIPALLQELKLSQEVLELSSGNIPAEGACEDTVLLITTMPSGWLNYHQVFFDRFRHSVTQWIVLLLNENPYVRSHLETFMRVEGSRLHIFATNPENPDFPHIEQQIRKFCRIRQKKVLLYSRRPNCGKETLKTLLQAYLPGWEFEITDQVPAVQAISNSNAAHVLIAGKDLKDFEVSVPSEVQPLYVLTMPDKNVQQYLDRASLPRKLCLTVSRYQSLTETQAADRLFFVSPLYELWHNEKIDPRLDERFLMWDAFGLPETRVQYTKENISAFLSQFEEGKHLAQKLRGKRDK